MPDLNPRESYGQLSFVNNTIESVTGDIDIQIGLTDSTADLKLNRNTVLAAGKTLGLVDVILDIPATLSAEDGVIVVDGAEGFRVGSIEIFQDTIESTDLGTDIQLGNIAATADLVLNRNTVLAAGKSLTFSDATVQTTASVNADWNATTGLSEILNKPDLSVYAPPIATRWSPTFQATGLAFTGSGISYPTYESYYVKYGQMVTFNIAIDMTTITNFGTGQFKIDLPFTPITAAANHFSAWSWVNPALPADDLNGHVQMVADHLPGSQTMDLHWLLAATSSPKPVIESLLVQGTPVTFTTASKIYVNGSYISAV